MMATSENRVVLERFYAAFAARDGATMAGCYHPNARFSDPVFDLGGNEIGAMWRMLCSRGKDLRVEATNLAVDDETGSADWQAWYSFSATGRPVHNRVHSRLKFADRQIIEQIDTFSFTAWSRQALGPLGLLLGWTSLLRKKVQSNARAALDHFIEKESLQR